MEQLGTLKAAEILLVEDSPTDRLLAIEALKSSGLMNSLSVVDNGVDAMHYLRKEGKFAGAKRPDLVLLDLNLPKKGGHEVLAEVKSDPRLMYIPVIVLTTSRSDEDLLRAYGHHANGYITKPVNFPQFADALRTLGGYWFNVVTLPPEAALERLPLASGEREPSAPVLKGNVTRVLLVDGSPAEALQIRDVLGGSVGVTFELVHVVRLSEAASYVQSNAIDVMLVECRSPEARNGGHLRRAINIAGNAPVIALTSSDDAAGQEALAEGADDYLIKSRLSTDAVLRATRHALEKRAHLEQLRQSQKREALGRLVAGVAHDFNNILSVVRGNAELLGEAEGLYAAKELAIEIQDAATRAGVIARQLLSFSRQQSQQPQVVDLTRQIDEFIPLVRRLLGDAVKLELDLAHDLPLVRVAPGMLDQVLLNLAINARDAMAHGGTFSVRTLAVELDEYAAERYRGGYPGVFVKLIVSDTGKGMPPEVLSRVFDPFFTTKAIEQGTGLGLSLVQGIVQQHRGWLDVASRVGEGTDFQIFIPATTQKIVQRSTRPPALRPSSGATILFVEEDVSLRLLATRVLKGHGYGVLEAGSEMEALSVWREHAANIDLVITEMCLPEGQTGTRLAAALARTRPAVQFIFASSCATQSGLNESGASDVTFEEGVDFLQKPYAMSSLIDIVEQRLPALPSA